jgi:hypothetical protein
MRKQEMEMTSLRLVRARNRLIAEEFLIFIRFCGVNRRLSGWESEAIQNFCDGRRRLLDAKMAALGKEDKINHLPAENKDRRKISAWYFNRECSRIYAD